MLSLGARSYDLVQAQSGFFLDFEPDRYPAVLSSQRWRFEAHYVPAPASPPPENNAWEYLRFTISSDDYQVLDWRNLSALGLDRCTEDDEYVWLGATSFENLLAGRFAHDEYQLVPDDLIVQRLSGYLFSCELDGFVRGPAGSEEEFYLQDVIPFAGMQMRVPINSLDPIKTARAIATREIQLTEFAQARLTPYDWRREKFPDAAGQQHLDEGHLVILTTPWREAVG